MVVRRENGMQWPWSGHQVISWLVYLYDLLVFFIQIFPGLSVTLMVLFGMAFVSSLIFLSIFMVRLTVSNPSDPLVQAYLNSEDQTYKKNLVESTTRHCNYCDAPVSEVRTKHCLKCNRCTLYFDHHCKFVNNCVGGLNYKKFLVLIALVEVHGIVTSGIFIWYVVYWSGEMDWHFLFVFLGIGKSVLTLGFNSYLLGFHVYLIRKKLTTYDFIIGRRKKLDSYVHPGQNLSDTNINI